MTIPPTHRSAAEIEVDIEAMETRMKSGPISGGYFFALLRGIKVLRHQLAKKGE